MSEIESWVHDITPRYQEDNVNGCWWACCQMLICYQRQANAFVERPEQVDPVFRSRVRSEELSAQQLYVDPRMAELQGYTMHDRNGQRLVSGFGFSNRILHPSHWWRHGVPPDPIHLGMLSRLVSLRNIPQVTARPPEPHAWLEAIRHRPMVLMFVVGGGQCHAVLGTGVRYWVKSNGTRDIDRAEVYILDPNASALTEWYSIAELTLLPTAGAYAAMHYRGGTYHAPTHVRVAA